MTLIEALRFLIVNGPGRTESQLSEAIFGDLEHQERIGDECNLLVRNGLIIRRGEGGPADPFRYFPFSVAERTDVGGQIQDAAGSVSGEVGPARYKLLTSTEMEEIELRLANKLYAGLRARLEREDKGE